MNVSSIQHMFQGNPYSTTTGSMVERATDPTTSVEDWSLLMDIVDNINRSDSGPRDAVRALKKRISSSIGKNNAAVVLALTCVETCVKNCGFRFHVQVASKEFLHELVKIIDHKGSPSQMLQERVLGLLQSWADAFRGEVELREVERTVIELRQKGYEFPMTDLDHMAPIHTPRRTVPEMAVLPKQSNLQQQQPPVPAVPASAIQHHSPQAHQPQMHLQQHPMAGQQSHPPPMHAARMNPQMTQHQQGIEMSGPVTPTTEQVAKLNHDLQVVTGNVRVFNEMLNELSPTGISPEDLSLMQELHRTCRSMQQRIMELLEQLSHEELTSELLRINDDLNNVFVRYGRFERYRSQQTGGAEAIGAAAGGVAAAGASGQAVAAVASPLPAAVLQQEQQNNNSPPPPSYNQAVSSEQTTTSLIDLDDSNDLSKRLADVRVSRESTGAQLSQLQSTTASNAQVDEFDMFAQSRTMAHSTDRRPPVGDSAYVPDTTSGGLSAAVNQKAALGEENFIPGIPDSQADLDEMESWMKTHDSVSVPMSSSEFDKFLAEHGAGSASAQPAPQPPSRRQMKNDDKEGALFAL